MCGRVRQTWLISGVFCSSLCNKDCKVLSPVHTENADARRGVPSFLQIVFDSYNRDKDNNN